jgi:hypothetical protein
MDLISGSYQTPCQNLTLINNSSYQLEFDLMLDTCHQSATISVKINNKILSSISSQNIIYPVHFTANFIT